MSEKERIKSILKGNISAFSYFVDTYQDMALTIAYRVSHNKQDAEDIVQDAFVKAFHNLHTFRFTSKFSTWLYRIVYNTGISHIKTPFYTTEYTDYNEVNEADNEWDIVDKLDNQQKTELLMKSLEKLPKDMSLILTLFYLEENSIKDIIFITGLSEANIKVKLHRGRKQLAEVFQSLMSHEYN